MRKILWCVSFLGFFSVKPFYIVRQKSPQPKRDMVHTAMMWCGAVCMCIYSSCRYVRRKYVCLLLMNVITQSDEERTESLRCCWPLRSRTFARSLARSIYRFLCLIVAQIGWKSSCPVAMPQAITKYVYIYV